MLQVRWWGPANSLKGNILEMLGQYWNCQQKLILTGLVLYKTLLCRFILCHKISSWLMARILIDNWPKQIRSLISKKLNTFTISSSGKSSRLKVAISDEVEYFITFFGVAIFDVIQFQSPRNSKANMLEKLITGYHK